MKKQYDKYEFLINMRKKQGLTQKKLAKMLNYSDKTKSKWENGDSFPTDENTLKEWASILGITVDELISGKIDKKYENVRDIKQEYITQLRNQRKKFAITLIIIFAVLVISNILLYNLEIKNSIKYYKIYAVSSNFEVYNSTLFVSPSKIMLNISNIENKTDYNIEKVILQYKNKDIYSTTDNYIFIEDSNLNSEYNLNIFNENDFSIKIIYNGTHDTLYFSIEQVFSNKLFYNKFHKNSFIKNSIQNISSKSFLEKADFFENDYGIYEKTVNTNVKIYVDVASNTITLNIYNENDSQIYDEYIYIKNTNNILFSSYYHQKQIYDNSIDIEQRKFNDCSTKCDTLDDYIDYIIYISKNL